MNIVHVLQHVLTITTRFNSRSMGNTMHAVLFLLCVTALSTAQAEEKPALTQAEIATLTERAEQGDAAAQKSLADAYLKGDGVQRDGQLGRQWMEKSAAQNHVPAITYLAYAHLRDTRSFDKDLERSMQYAEQADATGTAEGALAYGALIIGGWYNEIISDTHRKRAAERLKYAYENGEKEAAAQLARGYQAGWFGEPANGEKARQWYETWAESGTYYAHQELARLYEEGKLLPRDYKKALHHYALATQRLAQTKSEGEHNSQTFLGRMYFRMAELNERIQPPNLEAAFGYYDKAIAGPSGDIARMRHARIALDHGDAELVPRVVAVLAQRGREGDEAATCLLITAMKEGRNGFPPNAEGVANWTPYFEQLVFDGYNVPSENDAWLDYDLAACKNNTGCRKELELSIQHACDMAYVQKAQ